MSRFSNLLIYQSLIIALIFSPALADEPAGYYDSAEGLVEAALQQALHDIIDNHTSVSYTSLWTHFQSTDRKSNGKVWDMYSDVPGGTPPYEFTFVNDQCGNYSAEGDCYNREHSWPRSWFNDVAPMNTDLFHLYPTDGYVNGRRGNYPYGEVGSTTWTSQNGSKVGSCSYPGYTDTVFEPIDEYKGDIARTYFYMSVRYYNEDSGWVGSPMTNGAQLDPWALAMLMDWHTADSVSDKELDRNDAVYAIQNNRNPFIDRPYFVDNIWGDPVSIDQGNNTITPTPRKFILNPAYPNPFNPSTTFSVQINQSTEMTISVIDLTGRQVVQLERGLFTPGLHQFNWDGLTADGRAAASGLYFIVVGNDPEYSVRKIALMR
ncbi:MAG: endonuclease [Candidatus Marinimicrobia bacterium]|nr:endonuclease [Candidatus Neomarinimicrobiota bacterium]